MIFNSLKLGTIFKVRYFTVLASFDNHFDRSHLKPADTVLNLTGYLGILIKKYKF